MIGDRGHILFDLNDLPQLYDEHGTLVGQVSVGSLNFQDQFVSSFTPQVDPIDFHEIPAIQLGQQDDGAAAHGGTVPTYLFIGLTAADIANGGQFFEFQAGGQVFAKADQAAGITIYGDLSLFEDIINGFGSGAFSCVNLNQLTASGTVELQATSLYLANLPITNQGANKLYSIDGAGLAAELGAGSRYVLAGH